MEWEAAHADATVPPLQLPVVPEGEAIGTNPITAAEKEVEGKLLPLGRKAKTTWSYWKMTANKSSWVVEGRKETSLVENIVDQ